MCSTKLLPFVWLKDNNNNKNGQTIHSEKSGKKGREVAIDQLQRRSSYM